MNIKKSITILKDPNALLSYLLPELGKNVDLKKINIYRENEKLLVADYTFFNNQKTYNLIGKLRFDGHINTAKAQYMNLSKIEKIIKNKLIVPSNYFYLHQLNALFYEKVTGESLAEIIEKKKNVSKIYLDKCLTWMLAREKTSFSKNIKLNPQFKPEFFLQQAQSLSGKDHQQVHKLTSQIYELRLAYQLEKSFLCHNDFQPQNIFFEKSKLKTIDFDNVILDDPMIDFTNFYTQLRSDGKIPKIKLEQMQEYLLANYTKKTKLKENFQERFYLYLAIASLKNLNKHLAEDNQKQINFRLKKITEALKYFDAKKN